PAFLSHPAAATAATALPCTALFRSVNLMDSEEGAGYTFTMYGAADEIVPLLVKGDLDAAAIPANLAATLYQKTEGAVEVGRDGRDRKSTRPNSSHVSISYAVFCLKK